MTDTRDRLRQISTFPSLVKFLRDDLDWPIDSEDFEDLTFDYTPSELGIDPASAAKIDEIKRLRPLVANQPLGIFFVKFEPKQLPVVALRRILNSVVVKKRATASAAEHQKWATDDLLFISNYGEDEERKISFAHFSQDPSSDDLPTLRVLAWDDLDTPLHLEHAASTLVERLSWPRPEQEWDDESWRERWRSAFELRHREVVTTSKALAEKLAQLARAIRERIRGVLEIETDDGPVTGLMKAFREALIHDLDAADFADMYAQTIAYGLLSARVANPSGDGSAAHLPVTNPFLKELMETFLHVGGRKGKAGRGPGIDFDELGVSEVVELLDDANMDAVVRDFGDRNPQEDPVIHFYELFLKEYDAKKRMQRGVFYTPRPVVSYIVRSVDELLRTEFGLDDGLADTTSWAEVARRNPRVAVPDGVAPADAFVQILDPATGTGTFLVEVIDVIHQRLQQKWAAAGRSPNERLALWNEYVPSHLLPRLHGYELLMAPYAIAHLKVGLKLYETGYRFESDERARIYLTNSLEPAQDFSGQLDIALPALAHEADAVNTVKREQRFTVIVGNPPYSDASQNLGEQFAPLIARFRNYEGERIREKGAIRFEHAINNDYVKFWGLVLQILERSDVGTACLITSSSFLEGKSFRGLREGILDAVGAVEVTDLHGEGWSGPLAQAGTKDENVFEIQTGVAVTHLHKRLDHALGRRVQYSEVAGSYADKVAALLGDSPLGASTEVGLEPRQYLSFVPASGARNDEYWDFEQVDSFFASSVDGIKTSRDGLVIGNTADECQEEIRRFGAATETPVDAIEREFHFSANRFDVRRAQHHIDATFDPERVVPIGYRPLDVRQIYYDRELILSHRMTLMPSMLDPQSWAIVFASRLSAKGFDHAVATRTLCTNKYASHDINSRLFPVVCLEEVLGQRTLRSNVKPDVLDRALVDSDLDECDRAEMFGAYVYAVTNAPSYRERYRQEIAQDFPRVPLAKTAECMTELAQLGRQLVEFHCLSVAAPVGEFPLSGPIGEVIRPPRWKKGQLWVGDSSVFDGVGEEIWTFRMAGYQLCKSWFSAGGKVGLQRQGRPLTPETIAQVTAVLWAIKQTLVLRAKVDAVIDEHGGWPGAFATSDIGHPS